MVKSKDREELKKETKGRNKRKIYEHRKGQTSRF